MCRTNPHVTPLGMKTTAWFGTDVLGAGSKVPRARGEQELLNKWGKNAAIAGDPG